MSSSCQDLSEAELRRLVEVLQISHPQAVASALALIQASSPPEGVVEEETNEAAEKEEEEPTPVSAEIERKEDLPAETASAETAPASTPPASPQPQEENSATENLEQQQQAANVPASDQQEAAPISQLTDSAPMADTPPTEAANDADNTSAKAIADEVQATPSQQQEQEPKKKKKRPPGKKRSSTKADSTVTANQAGDTRTTTVPAESQPQDSSPPPEPAVAATSTPAPIATAPAVTPQKDPVVESTSTQAQPSPPPGVDVPCVTNESPSLSEATTSEPANGTKENQTPFVTPVELDSGPVVTKQPQTETTTKNDSPCNDAPSESDAPPIDHNPSQESTASTDTPAPKKKGKKRPPGKRRASTSDIHDNTKASASGTRRSSLAVAPSGSSAATGTISHEVLEWQADPEDTVDEDNLGLFFDGHSVTARYQDVSADKSPEAGCYLVFDPQGGGKLVLHYSKTRITRALGFYSPGPDHSIAGFKFTRNHGRVELIGNCAAGLAGKKNYYSGWCQFIRAAKDVNGSLWVFAKKESQPGLDVDRRFCWWYSLFCFDQGCLQVPNSLNPSAFFYIMQFTST